ncbi:MAG: hypothetical protein GAK29_04006 [Acinetobacter bereziniae]|uniref:Uncharacterized protein n=1 Tax=Acinetobacter bereziniae TaxID=106648 RepID=A0A833P9S9_ACIBZ|nr:MAG: hypothetical protein GAK29_04006 [Acinetobacter bereziniae]
MLLELLFKLIPGVEILLLPELEFEEELLLLLFKLLVLLELLLVEELLEFELTACPVTKPCKISERFFALAYLSLNTFRPPKRSADGTSSISIILRIRLRVPVSPLIKIRLVRTSAIIRTRAPAKSLDAPVALIASNCLMISSA